MRVQVRTLGYQVRHHLILLFSAAILSIPTLAPQRADAQTPQARFDWIDDPGTVPGQRPANCPQNARWAALGSPGNVTVEGHYFNANPFFLSASYGTTGFYMSSKGADVISTDGSKIWMDAKVYATCWIAEYLFGTINAWWAHWEYPLGGVWDRCDGPAQNRVPSSSLASQPASFEENPRPGCGGGSPGAGSGGGTMWCYTTTTDYYYYYPDTGQVEYRYSTVVTVCEMT